MVKPVRVVVALTAATMALAACGGGSSGTGSSGGSGKTVIISTDLPLQGASKDASDATNQAIELYLSQIGNKVGDYTIKLQKYDNATAAAGKWDAAQCAKNASDHVGNKDEIAVMGTFNSGCAKVEVPVLNQDPSGPMLMVSHANTNPGITKAYEAGEPEKYYPTGKRNYARVVSTDDAQGLGVANFVLNTLKSKACYVLNDNETYGQGIAKYFAESAAKLGIKVIANEPWDAKATSYQALFQKIKASGADCIFLGGIFDNNGGKLVQDKVAVLGPNDGAVKLLAPDGFSGYPDTLDKLAEAQGMYISFAGLTTDQLRAKGGAAGKLLDDYKAKYGSDPASNYALYGVSAMQVILAALKDSDGTRKGVNDVIFTKGVTIPEAESVTGVEVTIDPKTGDVTNGSISIMILKDQKETFLQEAALS